MVKHQCSGLGQVFLRKMSRDIFPEIFSLIFAFWPVFRSLGHIKY
jgi:hypothetical protein